MQLSSHDRVRIAAQAIVHPRTVARVYEGEGTDYSRARVCAAAEALGLPPPPAPAPDRASTTPTAA